MIIAQVAVSVYLCTIHPIIYTISYLKRRRLTPIKKRTDYNEAINNDIIIYFIINQWQLLKYGELCKLVIAIHV